MGIPPQITFLTQLPHCSTSQAKPTSNDGQIHLLGRRQWQRDPLWTCRDRIPPSPFCSGVIKGYSYFGGLPNPNPENNSPSSHKGNFAALFSHNARCSHQFSKQKKIDIFCTALGVNIDVLLGNSPPPPIVDICRTFHKDMRRKGQWKMDCIALPVYHLAKFVHKCIEAQELHLLSNRLQDWSADCDVSVLPG